MPEGRAERAVEAAAQSIDGAEHGAMLKGVMATAQHQGQNRPDISVSIRLRAWA